MKILLQSFCNHFQKEVWYDYARYDIVADSYRESSIKSAEERKHGMSANVLIGSIKSKLPRDMNKFMLNNNSKTSLISWFCTLDTEKIILSGDDECITVTSDSTEENVDLKSNQEETDTKVVLLSMNVIRSGGGVAIRSPSGDTDIMVLALALIDGLVKAYFDYGNGKCRKQMYLGAVGMKDKEKTGACRVSFVYWT